MVHKWAEEGSNLRPVACEATVLPLNYPPNTFLLFVYSYQFVFRSEAISEIALLWFRRTTQKAGARNYMLSQGYCHAPVRRITQKTNFEMTSVSLGQFSQNNFVRAFKNRAQKPVKHFPPIRKFARLKRRPTKLRAKLCFQASHRACKRPLRNTVSDDKHIKRPSRDVQERPRNHDQARLDIPGKLGNNLGRRYGMRIKGNGAQFAGKRESCAHLISFSCSSGANLHNTYTRQRIAFARNRKSVQQQCLGKGFGVKSRVGVAVEKPQDTRARRRAHKGLKQR